MELALEAQVLETSRDMLKFRVSEMALPGVFKRYFPPRTSLFRQNTGKTGNNAVKMSQVFRDIKHFTDLSLFKNAFNIENACETDALQWLTSQRFWPATGPY